MIGPGDKVFQAFIVLERNASLLFWTFESNVDSSGHVVLLVAQCFTDFPHEQALIRKMIVRF